MPFTPEQVETIRAGVRKREAARHAERIRAIERVEVRVEEGLRYRSSEMHGEAPPMTVDEPPERGGTNAGSSPLGHFLTGAGACLLNQFVRISVADGFDLRFSAARVRAEFARNPGSGMERIISEVDAEGQLDSATAEQLTERAESLCYIHNTLARTCRMTTILRLNGEEVVRRVSEPDGGAESGTGR